MEIFMTIEQVNSYFKNKNLQVRGKGKRAKVSNSHKNFRDVYSSEIQKYTEARLYFWHAIFVADKIASELRIVRIEVPFSCRNTFYWLTST